MSPKFCKNTLRTTARCCYTCVSVQILHQPGIKDKHHTSRAVTHRLVHSLPVLSLINPTRCSSKCDRFCIIFLFNLQDAVHPGDGHRDGLHEHVRQHLRGDRLHPWPDWCEVQGPVVSAKLHWVANVQRRGFFRGRGNPVTISWSLRIRGSQPQDCCHGEGLALGLGPLPQQGEDLPHLGK